MSIDRVKIFASKDIARLQDTINDWFEQYNNSITEVKNISTTFDGQYYISTVLYRMLKR